MWRLVLSASALLASVQGACDTNTLFFGDLDPSSLPPYQLPVISALGSYVLEPNNVSLVAYRHIGRPDQFILREPTEAPQKKWVVATLPDNKKPTQVARAYEAWPEAGNILAWGEFGGEPWSPGAGAWEVRDCDEGRTPLPSLTLSCVEPTFGQCASDRWRVVSPDSTFVDVLTPSDKYSHGRREYRSQTQRLFVAADGRWRLGLISGAGKGRGIVSAAPAERVEFVREWHAFDPASSSVEWQTDKKVQCEPTPTDASDPCAAQPCKNNGTCFPAPGVSGAYLCRCQFDSVSVNCQQVRECKAPTSVANARLLFTSDLSPQGKAFYRCDIGYYVKNGTGSAGNKTTNSAFATCDGRQWQNVPKCEPITTRVTIEAAYVHHCNFDAGWCDGYSHAPTLTLTSRTLGWERAVVANSDRGHVANAKYGSGGSSGGRQLALLQTPCMFVPTEGCVALDIRMVGNATLTVTDDDEVTLWRATRETDWTTATLTLPPGSNRLTLEAVLEKQGALVSVDSIRVFQWNCGEVTKLLFPKPRPSRGAGGPMVAETVMPLLSLLALLAYSGLAGVLTA